MLSANTDLKFVKIKSKENINMSTSLDSEEEERIISSLQEGIKILPNGCYLIQATKILNMNSNNSKIDTKQSDANTSTTICSSNTKFIKVEDMDKVYEFIKHKKRGNMKNISDKYNGSLVNNN